MTVAGILLSQMNEPPGLEDEFHDWYDSEHIPDRLVIPGFTAASRYEVVDGAPRWLVVYEVDDVKAFEHQDYLRLKAEPSDRTRAMLASVTDFTRYTCELISDEGEQGRQEYLVVEALTAPPGNGHAAEGTRVRRYRVAEGVGGPWTHFVLRELAAPASWSPSPSADAVWLYRLRSRQEARG